MRLSRGRLAKYESDSSSLVCETRPSMRICRSSGSQWKRSAARGPRREPEALAALAVGEEDRAALVEAPQQHDVRRRMPVWIDRREGHRVGIRQAGRLGVLEPGACRGDRIGGRMVEVEVGMHGRGPFGGRGEYEVGGPDLAELMPGVIRITVVSQARRNTPPSRARALPGPRSRLVQPAGPPGRSHHEGHEEHEGRMGATPVPQARTSSPSQAATPCAGSSQSSCALLLRGLRALRGEIPDRLCDCRGFDELDWLRRAWPPWAMGLAIRTSLQGPAPPATLGSRTRWAPDRRASVIGVPDRTLQRFAVRVHPVHHVHGTTPPSEASVDLVR